MRQINFESIPEILINLPLFTSYITLPKPTTTTIAALPPINKSNWCRWRLIYSPINNLLNPNLQTRYNYLINKSVTSTSSHIHQIFNFKNLRLQTQAYQIKFLEIGNAGADLAKGAQINIRGWGVGKVKVLLGLRKNLAILVKN